jgi:Cys-tRNA(Pro) deacylase
LHHVRENTPATQLLKAHKVAFTEHPYEYLEHGGAQHSAAVLGLDPFMVVKTLVMQDQDAKPLVVLMHGNRKVSTKNLARQIGAKSVEPCKPEVANRHSGYLVGGTSPFGTRVTMPVYIEESILELPRIAINGGRRGFSGADRPAGVRQLLGATPGAVRAGRIGRRAVRCVECYYPRSCFDRRLSRFGHCGCLPAGLAVVCRHRHAA